MRFNKNKQFKWISVTWLHSLKFVRCEYSQNRIFQSGEFSYSSKKNMHYIVFWYGQSYHVYNFDVW